MQNTAEYSLEVQILITKHQHCHFGVHHMFFIGKTDDNPAAIGPEERILSKGVRAVSQLWPRRGPLLP
jgi:hypothetical protein